MSATNVPPEEENVITWIENIKNQKLDPRMLSDDQRRECVQFLKLQHLNHYQIAKFLGRCDRTIRRDLERIRAESAVRPNTNNLMQAVGEIQASVLSDMEALKKLADSPETAPRERIRARSQAARIGISWMRTLQSVGLNYSKSMEGAFG